MLRRNLERDNAFDAKRYGRRNVSDTFAFGSSTPRSLNLDSMGTLSPFATNTANSNQHQHLVQAIPPQQATRPVYNDDCTDATTVYVKRRPVSAYLCDERACKY